MKNWLKFTAFIVVLVITLAGLDVFVFTGELKNSHYAQFFAEEDNSLDLVFIGNSTVRSGIIPMEIWNEHKITSFNISNTPTHPEVIILAVEEVMLHHNPKLIFIDITGLTFQGKNDKISYVEDFISAMPNSKHKDELKEKYNNFNKKNELFAYHNDFRNPEYYEYSKGNRNKYLKGFAPKKRITALSESTIEIDQQVIDLPQDGKYYLKELLDTCAKYEQVDFIFARMPRVITPESIQETYMLNSAISTINEYGYEYVNFEEYYEEIGLDSTKDFADAIHMNYWGALKFTKFVMPFLKVKYDLKSGNYKDNVIKNFNESYKKYKSEIKQIYNKKTNSHF